MEWKGIRIDGSEYFSGNPWGAITHHEFADYLEGIVTSPMGERKKFAPGGCSSYREHLAPNVHRGGAERSERSRRYEMALDVEEVVNGGVG
jgi:hypothetical protein